MLQSTLSPTDITLRDHLWTLSLTEALEAFDVLDRGGTDFEAIKTLCRISLFYLVIKLFKWTEYAHPWSYERVRDVDMTPDGAIDLWFRSAGKTSIITVAKSIQDLIVFDNLAIIIYGNTYTIAQKNLRLIKTILESNQALKSLFPERFFNDPQKESPLWTAKQLTIVRTISRKEPSILASGFDRGLPTGAHADILIYDDIVTQESCTTKEQLEKTTDAFYRSKPTGTMDAKRRIIGTRYDPNDLYGALINSQSYLVRLWPATTDGTTDGTPYIHTQKQWDDICNDPSSGSRRMIACQYLQDPVAGMERVFNVSNLYEYEVREHRLNVYILVDPASSTKEKACDTAMAVIGIAGRKRKYLLDGYCHKMTISEKYTNLRNLHEKWTNTYGVKKVVVGYETHGSGETDVQAIEELLKRDKYRMKILDLKGPISGDGRKNTRIERIQPDLDSHQIFIPYPTDGDRLTKAQVKAMQQNNSDLIAKPIRKLNNTTKEIYDLTDIFKLQLLHFPTGNKDFLDAFSRIYDPEVAIRDPVDDNPSFAELSVEELV